MTLPRREDYKTRKEYKWAFKNATKPLVVIIVLVFLATQKWEYARAVLILLGVVVIAFFLIGRMPSTRRAAQELRVAKAKEHEAINSAPISSTTHDAPDIPDQLRQLGQLRDAGVLTAQEFEDKKRVLLPRM
jgi:ABC-type multidrug transport system fused ATPase/permease subunit